MIKRRLDKIEKQVKESKSINLLEKKFLILLIKMFKNDIQDMSRNKLANMGRYIDNINIAAKDDMEEIYFILKEHLN
jgi:hypothetical protein